MKHQWVIPSGMLSRPQRNAQSSPVEASADMEGRKETGDWRQWYPNHKHYVRVIWVLSEHQSKTSQRAFAHRFHLSQPLLFSHKHNSSQLLLLSSGKQVSPPSGWSQADPSALWRCRGLFGKMWTQHPVFYRRGWPKTYWILGAESGALGQSGRLRLRRAGQELMFVQKPKREVTEHRRQPLTPG